MESKFNQFQAQVIGKSIEKEDSSNLDQCMDLIFAWCDFLGIPRDTVRHPVAYQVWTNATDETKKYFDLLTNTLTFIPKAGDIAVFGTKVGNAGHVSIDTGKSNVINLNTLDQNWDTQHYNLGIQNGQLIPYTRLVTHNWYYGIIGFLRPKINQGDDVIVNEIKSIIDSSQSPHDKLSSIRALLA